MVFPIVGGTQSTGYEISNSLRFNDGDNPKLAFTPSSAVVAERKTFTISCWVKRGIISTVQYLWEMGGNDNANDRFFARFDASDKLKISDSGTTFRETNRLFRDPSAWYHIVVAVDTTDSTAGNRVKVYVNGVQETSFATSNNPGQNDQKGFSDDSEHTIGRTGIDDGFSLDGYMADFNAVGGSQLAPTSFGETNDNGVWIPKNYTGSYGTNGFFLEFQQTGTSQNSSGIGADTSGNDNHFAVTNLAATDVTTDTPTNNFATMNSTAITNSNSVLSEGNTVHTVTGGSAWLGAYSTLGFASGKWYAELKVLDVDNTSWGVIQSGGDSVANFNSANSGYVGKYADGWGWWGNGSAAETINNNSNTSYGSAESVNDIYMIAVDVDGGKIWMGKNGTWFNAPGTSDVGDPANDNNPGFSSITFTDFVHFASGLEAADSDDAAVGWNFGNAAHSISSGNADANGYGNFEYAVPSGYYALCTKNLAEFG